MTKNNTVAAAHARIDGIEASINRILALLEGTKVADKVAAKVLEVPEVTVEAVEAKPEAPKGPSFKVVREALKAHKKAGLIRAGITAKEAIAEGLMDEAGNYLSNGTTVAPTVVVAEVKASAPAKPEVEKALTPAQIAHRDAPRRADGTCPPKHEWSLREALAEAGKFDRWEIEAKVVEAYANPLLVDTFGLTGTPKVLVKA